MSKRLSRGERAKSEEGTDLDVETTAAAILTTWANNNLDALSLVPGPTVSLHGFHPVYRVAPDGRLLIELVAQFVQQRMELKDNLGGISHRGGTTIVATVDGTVRYVIAKPLTMDDAAKGTRLNEQRDYLRALDACDPLMPYASPTYLADRMRFRMNLAALHGGG
jgi:hypothetical protein